MDPLSLPSPPASVDVLIQGAGPAGATLACLLADAGLRVALIDRAPLGAMEATGFDGRAYAIAAGARDLLARAGVWALLPSPPGPIEAIRVSDGKVGRAASPLFLHFDHAEAELGPFGWMVEARSLRVAVNRRLAQLPSVALFAPAHAAIRRSDAEARAEIDGTGLTASLVVAADGRNSALRREAGIGVAYIPYHQTGIVCAVSHGLPHHRAALEHFLPGGPFAQLPMAGTEAAPHLSALVWTERAAFAERLMALPDAIFEREALRRLGPHLGQIRLVGTRVSHPLSLQHAERYVDTRLALVADAAHVMHPIAGQGLNVGFRDVQSLAELVIAAHRRGEDPGREALLAQYQRQRRPDNARMLAATDLLDRLFSTDHPALRLARDVGIGAVHRMPALKRRFMREAMAK